MDNSDHWIPDDVAQWLDHIGIHQHQSSLDMLYGEVTQVFSGSIMHNSSDDAVVVSGPVLQRLMQENLRYGNEVGSENQAMTSPGNPTSAEIVFPETQPRQEPQGQEHQVDSSSMEKNDKGAQNTAASIQVTLDIPGIGALDLPSYEEAKSQSQLYRGQQGQNEEQNVVYTHLNVHNTGNMLTHPSHTYTSLKNTNQAFNNPNPDQNTQIQLSLQPNEHIPTSTSSCPPSLSSAPSLSSFARAEGRSWVQRGFVGVDLGLAGLEQGHVRSLSERIMQLSLERNGARQPREMIPNSEEQMATPISPSSKTATPPPPKGSLDPRGPPPEYPFKTKAQSMYPSSISPGPLSLEQTTHSFEAPLGQISSLMPTVILQTGSGTRLPPQGQIVPAEAFSTMSHAQHMVTFLSEENQRLRQELLIQTEKMGKLQRLEAEVQRLSDAYENLVRSSSKRETLEKTMKVKLEGEIRRLHDFNRDLRDRLETANRKLANQDEEGQEDSHDYLSERRESLKAMERLETEAESFRSANEDQRRHIEILEQALNNAQSKVVRLEEELGRKCVYVERVERLQQALAQLQVACEKREQLEKRLRTRLERELETLRSQQRSGVGVCESSAPALLDLLREREERILGLEADRMRWEQKYLEESAMRQFAMEAAATAAAQRDTTIIQHSRSGSYSDACLWPHDEEDKTYNRCCQDIETRMKDLHAQLLEKIAMIKVLQHRSRRDTAPLRPSRSVPSITVATGVHSRQASQTESVLLGKENPDHLPPSIPSFTASLSSLVPSLSSSLPPSFTPLSVSTIHPSSVMASSSLPLASSSSLFLSSSATLNLPTTLSHSLPPLPPTVSSSLPSTPVLSLHSKSASRDSSTQTGRSPENVKIMPPTGRGRTTRMDWPTTQMKSPESRVLQTAVQMIRPADSDLLEILI
ncbi:angiomotin-like protein 1 isoform X1 [Tachysurus fulvidraco]|uniref:angiomotin-like protein 1 isoform X1 n=2 Tax=Tachysurus fulvidraco TaxID=1234273 RepID=UPI001FEE2B72|nr:angiomotin-like protein 1 isoform X1 [Tachysurus fulvidraco]